jgi:hypothetical protein
MANRLTCAPEAPGWRADVLRGVRLLPCPQSSTASWRAASSRLFYLYVDCEHLGRRQGPPACLSRRSSCRRARTVAIVCANMGDDAGRYRSGDPGVSSLAARRPPKRVGVMTPVDTEAATRELAMAATTTTWSSRSARKMGSARRRCQGSVDTDAQRPHVERGLPPLSWEAKARKFARGLSMPSRSERAVRRPIRRQRRQSHGRRRRLLTTSRRPSSARVHPARSPGSSKAPKLQKAVSLA